MKKVIILLACLFIINFTFAEKNKQSIEIPESVISDDLTLKDIIYNYYSTQSGLNEMDALINIRMRGQLKSKNEAYNITIFKHTPNLIRISETNPIDNSTTITVYDGKKVWQVLPGHELSQAQILPKKDNLHFINSASFFNALYHYEKNNIKPEYAGKKQLGDKLCYDIIVQQNDTAEIHYYIDVNNYLINQIDTIESINGEKIVKEAIYTDIRRVGPYSFPFRETIKINGSLESITEFDSIEYNAEKETEFFEFPRVKLSDILTRYYKTQGGLAAMNELQSVRIKGSIKIKNSEFDLTIFKRAPDLIRLSMTDKSDNSTTVVCYNGEVVWKLLPGQEMEQAIIVPMDEALNIISNAPIFNHLHNYTEKGINLEYLGEKLVAAIPCFEIKATGKKFPEIRYYIDTETYDIRQIKTFEIIDGKELITESILGDIRKINSFTVAFKMTNKLNGELDTITKLNEVKYSVGIFENYFDYPGLRLENILEKFYETQGGILSMDTLRSMRIKGTIKKGSKKYDLTIFKRKPNRIRISVRDQETLKTSIIAYDGKNVWQVLPGQDNTEAKRLPTENMGNFIKNASIFNYLYKPEEKNVKLKYLGTRRVAAIDCHDIQVIDSDNTETHYFLDINNFDVRLIRNIEEKDGKKIITESVLNDIRRVGDYTISFKTIKRVNGYTDSLTELEEVKYGIGIFESFFKFPGK